MKQITVNVKKTSRLTGLDQLPCGKCFVGAAYVNGGFACIFGNKDDAFKCFAWNCPLASPANLLSIKECEPEMLGTEAEALGISLEAALSMSDEELQALECEGWMRQFYDVSSIEIDGKELDAFRGLIRNACEEDFPSLAEMYRFNIIER